MLFGLAATWNIHDLSKEYIWLARIIVNGKIKTVDFLEYLGNVIIPGRGYYEYFISDGLRTMLRSLSHLRIL